MAKPSTNRKTPLRFEEKFREHLNLDDGSELATLLQNAQVFEITAGLMQAFLGEPPAHVERVLEQQRERGRRRKQAIPRAVEALIKAAGRYRDLQGLEQFQPHLAQQMEQEAFRLVVQLNRWNEIHNDKRLGAKSWIFLIILEDFLKFWSEHAGRERYQISIPDLLRLQTAGEQALGWQRQGANLPTVDELRGLAHFRANPRNQQLCELAAKYAYHFASHAHLRPFLILRNEN